MNLNYQQALDIMNNSEVLYTEEELNQQITRMANELQADIKNDIAVFLNVMNGGLFFGAKLLQQINQPIILDYVHASRYGKETYGSNHITWFRQPKLEIIQNRNVYIIDDILDEGHTLAEIKRFIMDIGAKSCKIVVLIDKNINKDKPIQADYVGLSSPNKFLFGYGMDIYGLYRQLPQIYAYTT